MRSTAGVERLLKACGTILRTNTVFGERQTTSKFNSAYDTGWRWFWGERGRVCFYSDPSCTASHTRRKASGRPAECSFFACTVKSASVCSITTTVPGKLIPIYFIVGRTMANAAFWRQQKARLPALSHAGTLTRTHSVWQDAVPGVVGGPRSIRKRMEPDLG